MKIVEFKIMFVDQFQIIEFPSNKPCSKEPRIELTKQK